MAAARVRPRWLRIFARLPLDAVQHGGSVPVELIHRNNASSVPFHRVVLYAGLNELSFNPGSSGNGCNLPTQAISLKRVRTAEVGHDGAGEVFLLLRVTEPGDADRTSEIRLWVPGIRVERRQVRHAIFLVDENVVVSPESAPQVLQVVVKVLHLMSR